MVRATFNLIVDLAAAVSLVGMIATGYILRYPLPANMHKTHTLWGLTRNQRGNIHFWMSAALVSIVVTHLVLHWRWVPRSATDWELTRPIIPHGLAWCCSSSWPQSC